MRNRFIRLGMLSLMLLSYSSSYGQMASNQFFERHLSTANTGMYVLGSWALVNMATGAYGWSRCRGHEKYFFQMNLFWNVVNLSIAGMALYSNLHLDYSQLSQESILQKSWQTERILLINSALDLGYVGTGFLLRHLSGKHDRRRDLLLGYGHSLMVQGGFLLVFDLILYGFMHHLRMDFLSGLSPIVTSHQLGVGLALKL